MTEQDLPALTDPVESVEPAPPPPPPKPLTPTEGSERIEIIDIVRGLALFGILAANIRGFAGPAVTYFQPEKFWPELHDRIAQSIINILIQGKFITIFAFLFGVGFAVQLERAEARGAKFGRFFSRRLFILILFGLVHGLLIWFGDILLVYAVTGFVLLLFRKRKDRTVVIWGVILYLLMLLLIAVAAVAVALTGQFPDGPPKATPESLAEQVEIFANGTWAQIQQQRSLDAIGQNWGYLPVIMWQILGIFLFGMLAFRKGFFTPKPESLPRYRRAMLWALPVGVVANIGAEAIRVLADVDITKPTSGMVMMMALQTIGIPALSLGYMCAVILLCHDAAWKARLTRFGAIGRTALSNYLLQSIVGTLIFYNYGLGLFGKIGPAWLLVPTFVIYALQAIVSPWWLERFQFGPAEWLWRSMTYGKRQPMRKAVADSARPKGALWSAAL